MKSGLRFGLPETTLMLVLPFSLFQAPTSLRWLLPMVLVACAQTPPAPKPVDAQTPPPATALAEPLDASAAVQLALHHSPAFQALLNLHQAQLREAAQQGRISNPLLTLDKLRSGQALEIGRSLSFGLLDILTWPQRRSVADKRLIEENLRLSSTVVAQVSQVRQAWVKAVATQQQLHYAIQVREAAQVSHDLARKMLSAGNFNKLQYARQQAFELDAQAEFLATSQAQVASRENLVRLLGLNDAQAQSLQLPDRLPDLPAAPLSAQTIAAHAHTDRLDVRLAQAQFDSLAQAQGFKTISTYTDIELGVQRDSMFDNANASSGSRRGYSVSMKLPLFDWGGLDRQALQAQTLAAGYNVEAKLAAAGSHVRQAYSAYLNAYQLVTHYKEDVLPLRKTISDEQLLRYNGMLLSVFDLLADSRESIATVRMALAAQEQFWLMDANLQSALVGLPTGEPR
jgi:outer membrane protein TolC